MDTAGPISAGVIYRIGVSFDDTDAMAKYNSFKEKMKGSAVNVTFKVTGLTDRTIGNLNRAVPALEKLRAVAGTPLNINVSFGRIPTDAQILRLQRLPPILAEIRAAIGTGPLIVNVDVRGTAAAIAATQKVQAATAAIPMAVDTANAKLPAGLAKMEQVFSRTINRLQFMVTAFALTFAAEMVGQSVEEAAKLESELRGLDITATRLGQSGAKSLAVFTGNLDGLRFRADDAAKALNRLYTVGLKPPPEQLTQLKGMAVGGAALFGGTASENLEKISVAAERMSTRTLRGMGIVFDAKVAQEVYAASIGKTTKTMTESEHIQAFWNGMMSSGGVKALEAAAKLDTMYKTLQEGQTTLFRAKVAFGDVIGEGLVPLVSNLNKLDDSGLKTTARFTILVASTAAWTAGLGMLIQALGYAGLKLAAFRDLQAATATAQAYSNAVTGGTFMGPLAVGAESAAITGARNAAAAQAAAQAPVVAAMGWGALAAAVLGVVAAYQEWNREQALSNKLLLDQAQAGIQFNQYLISMNVQTAKAAQSQAALQSAISGVHTNAGGRALMMEQINSTKSYTTELIAQVASMGLNKDAAANLTAQLQKLGTDGQQAYITKLQAMDRATLTSKGALDSIARTAGDTLVKAMLDANVAMAAARVEMQRTALEGGGAWQHAGRNIVLALGAVIDTIVELGKRFLALNAVIDGSAMKLGAAFMPWDAGNKLRGAGDALVKEGWKDLTSPVKILAPGSKGYGWGLWAESMNVAPGAEAAMAAAQADLKVQQAARDNYKYLPNDLEPTGAEKAGKSIPDWKRAGLGNAKQWDVVKDIIAEGVRRGASREEIIAALETGSAESTFTNIPHGDRFHPDAPGVFQQWAKAGYGGGTAWGVIAGGASNQAREFYERYEQEKDWRGRPIDAANMTPAQRAQAVQGSAFLSGSNYQAKAAQANRLADFWATDANATIKVKTQTLEELSKQVLASLDAQVASFKGIKEVGPRFGPGGWRGSSGSGLDLFLDAAGQPAAAQTNLKDMERAAQFSKLQDDNFAAVKLNIDQIVAERDAHAKYKFGLDTATDAQQIYAEFLKSTTEKMTDSQHALLAADSRVVAARLKIAQQDETQAQTALFQYQQSNASYQARLAEARTRNVGKKGEIGLNASYSSLQAMIQQASTIDPNSPEAAALYSAIQNANVGLADQMAAFRPKVKHGKLGQYDALGTSLDPSVNAALARIDPGPRMAARLNSIVDGMGNMVQSMSQHLDTGSAALGTAMISAAQGIVNIITAVAARLGVSGAVAGLASRTVGFAGNGGGGGSGPGGGRGRSASVAAKLRRGASDAGTVNVPYPFVPADLGPSGAGNFGESGTQPGVGQMGGEFFLGAGGNPMGTLAWFALQGLGGAPGGGTLGPSGMGMAMSASGAGGGGGPFGGMSQGSDSTLMALLSILGRSNPKNIGRNMITGLLGMVTQDLSGLGPGGAIAGALLNFGANTLLNKDQALPTRDKNPVDVRLVEDLTKGIDYVAVRDKDELLFARAQAQRFDQWSMASVTGRHG